MRASPALAILVLALLSSGFGGLGVGTGASSQHAPSPGTVLARETTPSRAAPEAPTPGLASVNLVSGGQDPTSMGLTWTPSPSAGFGSYEVDYSLDSAGGPWSVAEVTNNASANMTVVEHLPPGLPDWFRVIARAADGAWRVSNVLTTQQPGIPGLQYTSTGGGDGYLEWTNPSSYGAALKFGCYEIEAMNSSNGSTTGACLTNTEANTILDVSNISSGVVYNWDLLLFDNVSTGGSSTSRSSAITTGYNGYSDSVSVNLVDRPLHVDVGQPATATCLASWGQMPYSYRWLGLPTPSPRHGSGTTVGLVYNSSGTMGVDCDVTDAEDSEGYDYEYIGVSNDSTVRVSANLTDVIPGVSVHFSANASGGPGNFSSCVWNFGDGSFGSGWELNHTYAVAGAYNVSAVVTDANDYTSLAWVHVNVSSLEITAAANRTYAVPGMLVAFSANASGGTGGPYTYAWTFGDGGSEAGPSVAHAYGAAGTYPVDVVATDQSGYSNSTFVTKVVVLPTLAVQAVANATTVRPGANVSFEAQYSGGSGNVTCAWNFSDGTTSQGCSVTHAWTRPGQYLVRLTVTDREVGDVSASVSVEVRSPPSAGSATTSGATLEEEELLALVVAVAAIVAVVAVALRYRRRS